MKASSAAVPLPWGQVSDVLAMGVVILDADGRVQHWNAWMKRHSGVTPEEAHGRMLQDIWGAGMSAPFLRALGNALQYDLPVVMSNVLHRHPLPLFRLLAGALPEVGVRTRIPQTITLIPLQADAADSTATRHCVIQIVDTSLFIHREKVLQSRSEQLSKEVVIDGLTGVYNRKFFNQRLPVELSRALRSDSALSLIMMDVDCFKNYNDSYGHPAGDRVLQALAKTVQQQLSRPSDLLARYGGEEFIMILSGSEQIGAQQLAERIRLAIAALALPHAYSHVAPYVTVSLGVTTCVPQGVHNPEDALESVDQALYAAKRNGRNTTLWLPMRDGALSESTVVPTSGSMTAVSEKTSTPDFSVSGSDSLGL
ncbi:diguanylate cyclase domain-containing protein [Variovorax sp. HJSM1_2]|uniref:diguanylate cyclase domain-containing protein n=1 Tax=Variovorax sp. HJSM1_2 TaxID=3366263 RepID=UPI003BC47238